MIFARFIRATIDTLGWYNFLTWLLLATALISLTQTLAEAIRGLEFGLSLTMALLGLLIGWGLATIKRLPAWLAAVLIIILGLEIAIFWVGRLESFVFSLGDSLVGLISQLWRQPFDSGASLLAIGQIVFEAGQSVVILLLRLAEWIGAIARGNPVYDPVAVILIWSVALWSTAAWAGWATRRLGRPLLALLPTGIFLAATLAYYPRNVSAMFPMLGATLLLIGLTKHRLREQHWQTNGIDYSDHVHVDSAIAIIAITAALLSLASLMPSISIWQIAHRFTEPAQLSQPLVESLGVRRELKTAISALESFRRPGLPQGHLLGSGPELSEQVALIIQVEYPEPISSLPRYKWRSLTYDRYTGLGWRTGTTQPFSYEASEAITNTPPPHRRLLRQNVEVVRPQRGQLHTAGDLLTANQPYHVEWRGPDDPFGIIIEADIYQADVLVSTATELALRSAGSDYPDWIERRYISLPEQIPARVLTLARDLTANAPTPYDRAKAIESYLRKFPYSLDLPEPPRQRDMVDYFLFDLQQGYCDYYATSMVVLARAAGLPARMAVGYATGTYDTTNNQYIITEADAHSWPEIYFPDYGWIAFEPTAAQPVTDPVTEAEAAAELLESLPVETTSPRSIEIYFGWGLLILGGATLLTLSGATWSIIDGWRLRRLTPALAITILFDRLQSQGQGLTLLTQPGNTPFEFATALEQKMITLAQLTRWKLVFDKAQTEVAWLTQLYVRTIYSTHPPEPSDQTQAIEIWQRLHRRLWLAKVLSWWQRRR